MSYNYHRAAANRIGITEAEYRARREAGWLWCSGHKNWAKPEAFRRSFSNATGRQTRCRDCQDEYDRGRDRGVWNQSERRYVRY